MYTGDTIGGYSKISSSCLGAVTPQSFPQPKVPPYASGIRFLTQGLSVYGFGVRDSTVLSTLFITTIGASHVYERTNSVTGQ